VLLDKPRHGLEVLAVPLEDGGDLRFTFRTIDPQAERFEGTLSQSANMMLSRNYRAPFIVPDEV